MNKITNMLVSRAAILIAGAAGGFILSEWPTVHTAMCTPVQYYQAVP